MLPLSALNPCSALALLAMLGIFSWNDQLQAASPAAKLSHLSVPITLQLTQLEQKLNQSLPKPLHQKLNWGGKPRGFWWKLRRGPVSLRAAGAKLFADVRLTAHLQARKKLLFKRRYYARCQQPPQIDWGIQSHLKLTPDWRLQSSTSQRHRHWRTRCKLKILVLKIDATPFLDRAIDRTLPKIFRKIDRKIAQLADVRKHVQRVWKALSSPIPLGRNGWLVLQPKKLYVGSLRGSHKQLRLRVGLTARPQVVFGPKPATTTRPLPNHQGAPKKGGFQIRTSARLTFDQANQQLQKALLGKAHLVKLGDLKIYLRFQSVTASLRKKRLVIKGVLKQMRGSTLMLWGTPVYDPRTQIVSLRDLGIHFLTPNRILARKFMESHKKLRSMLQAATRWPMAPHIQRMRGLLQKGLNRRLSRHVSCKGQLEQLRLLPFRITPKAFHVGLMAAGHASVQLH